ncbi:sensory box sensor histidine kinase [Vibrio cholerae]|nr:sensory box sensor histidine kinase [Vibrio cholerae]
MELTLSDGTQAYLLFQGIARYADEQFLVSQRLLSQRLISTSIKKISRS